MDAHVHSPYLLESKLTGAISIGNIDLAKQILGEINKRERAKLAPGAVRSNKNSVIASITLFTRAAISAGIADEEAYTISDRLINKVEACSTLDEINAVEYQALEEVAGHVADLLNNRYSGIVLSAMQAIRANLKEKHTLSSVAAKISVSPAYLSELFTKETGKPISRYIASEKVKESIFYLRKTDYSVAGIADLYSFSSVSYYIKHFKAVMGCTPGNYRAEKP